MTRAMASNWDNDRVRWDFLYPTVVFALGVLASAAIYVQISGL